MQKKLVEERTRIEAEIKGSINEDKPKTRDEPKNQMPLKIVDVDPTSQHSEAKEPALGIRISQLNQN